MRLIENTCFDNSRSKCFPLLTIRCEKSKFARKFARLTYSKCVYRFGVNRKKCRIKSYVNISLFRNHNLSLPFRIE